MASKTRVTIYISNDLLDYINEKIQDHTFANVSHGVELAVARYRDREQKGGERD